ncbi:MAG: protein-L-isoaspartate O-methyltransferase, partial [Patescibacteria group bacterium]
LAVELVEKGVLKTPLIIDAFKNIDRADFVLEDFKKEAYEDYPLPIGYNVTISQPTTVAFMMELLELKAGDMVLDVGSGSGFTTALLSQIVGKQRIVLGVEIIPELVEFGNKNLKKYPHLKAEIVLAKKEILGLPEKAPFDKILVSASANELPQELINQLNIRGILVIPIKNSIWKIDKISENKIKKQEFYGFSFVPLL